MPSAHFLPLIGNDSIGQRTLYGTWLPPGSRVAAYVGPQSDSTDAYVNSSLLVSTLAAGLARCRAAKNDCVIVLPGHTETVSTITMLDNLVSGTQVIGMGAPNSSLMPTFTFAGTTTTSAFVIDDANTSWSGLRFNLNGADSMDTPIRVTATGTTIRDCVILTGSDTALDSDIAVTFGATSDRSQFLRNYVYATGSAVNTNSLLISGSVDSLKVMGNTFIVPCTSTNGIVDVSGTVTNLEIGLNRFVNTSTGSACLRFADVAMTGIVYDNYCGLTANTAPLTTGISLAGTTNILLQFFNNQTNDGEAKGTSGLLSPAVNDGN